MGFGVCFKGKSCSALLRLVIDQKKSPETNLMNLFSRDILSLRAVYVLFLACCMFQYIILSAFSYAFVDCSPWAEYDPSTTSIQTLDHLYEENVYHFDLISVTC